MDLMKFDIGEFYKKKIYNVPVLIKIGQFGEFYKKKLSPHLNFD
jgi:hypothetical protein